MAVLAGRVQRREPRPVLDVDVGPRRAQQGHRLTEPALRRTQSVTYQLITNFTE